MNYEQVVKTSISLFCFVLHPTVTSQKEISIYFKKKIFSKLKNVF